MALTIAGITAGPEFDRLRAGASRLARTAWQDLFSFVPPTIAARWRRILRLPGPLVIMADPTGQFHEVGAIEGPISTEAISTRSRTRNLALRIDEGRILRRRLDIPRAATTRLEAALDMNLRIWTPFDPTEVYAAAYSLIPEKQGPGAMQPVELRCVPRAAVDECIEALHRSGLDPDALELGDARFTLPRETRKRIATRRRSWLIAGLTLLLLGQGVAAYAIMSSRQADELAELAELRDKIVASLQRRVSAEKEAAAGREAMRKVIARLDEELSFSHALHLLGAALPQDAVVREFEAGREGAQGHLVILGAPGLDVVETLAGTKFYRVSDLTVLPGSSADRRVFSAGFAVSPWAQADGRAAR